MDDPPPVIPQPLVALLLTHDHRSWALVRTCQLLVLRSTITFSENPEFGPREIRSGEELSELVEHLVLQLGLGTTN